MGSDGSAYVTGRTGSYDLPVAPGADRFIGGTSDAFVLKLTADGQNIGYATYLGGAQDDTGAAIGAGADGGVYVTGSTTSPDFPLQGAVQEVYGGLGDAFLARLSPHGEIVFSTYLGGERSDAGRGIAVEAGFAHVVGEDLLDPFPGRAGNTPSGRARQRRLRGEVRCLRERADPCAAARRPRPRSGARYRRGPGRHGLVGGASSGALVASTSPREFRGAMDAFIVRMDAAGIVNALALLGGAGEDVAHGAWRMAHGVAVDEAGAVHVAGLTDSIDLPVVRALQLRRIGHSDTFVASLGAADLDVQMLTYLGGARRERGVSIAAHSPGFVYLGGSTESEDFPMQAGVDEDSGGAGESFLGRINLAGHSANLVLAMDSAPEPAVANRIATLTVGVRNDGPDAATQTQVTVTVFNRVDFVAVQSSRGNCVQRDDGTRERLVIVCDLGMLAFGGDARVDLRVRPSNTGSLTAVAQVEAAEPDIAGSDNHQSVTGEVLAAAPSGDSGGGGLGGIAWPALAGLMWAASRRPSRRARGDCKGGAPVVRRAG